MKQKKTRENLLQFSKMENFLFTADFFCSNLHVFLKKKKKKKKKYVL